MVRIAVIGQSGEIPQGMRDIAYDVGKEIALNKALLMTGGTSGVMEYSSKGAKEAGSLVLGFLAGDSLDSANDYIDIPITTGLPFDFRSSVLIHSSDAVIVIGGCNGTLGELSCAYLNKKPIIVLESSGGLSSKIKDFAYEGCYIDERKNIKLNFCSDAKTAVDTSIRHYKERTNKKDSSLKITSYSKKDQADLIN